MSLRSKIVLILFAVIVLYTGLDNGSLRVIASHIFESWELEQAEQSLDYAVRRLEEENHELAGMGALWSGWDAMYDYVVDPDPEFVEDNLGPQALSRANVDLVMVCDVNGTVLWHRIQDPVTSEEVRLHELPTGALSSSHRLLNFGLQDEAISGLMMTDLQPLLVSSHPIPGPGGESLVEALPFRQAKYGTLILGRFMDPELTASIESASNVAIEVAGIDDAELGADEAEILSTLTAAGGTNFASRVSQDDMLYLYRAVQDLRTGEYLLLKARIGREITTRGENAVNYALLSTLAGALLILFVLLRLLQKIVIRPLSTLTKKAVEIGATDDTTIKVGMQRDDEIGQLADEFDRMLDKLATSREEVVKTARLAGMSEIATGVLHNVGNVLNSVNVSANVVRKQAQRLSIDDLNTMVGVLGTQEDLGRFVTEDPKGKHFLPFLTSVSQTLLDERETLLGELRSLGKGIDHIAELVRSQQSYAGTKGVFEKASLADQIDTALRICSQAHVGVDDFELVREFEELPAVSIDKHKLMEIMVNLIQNARHSVEDAGVSPKILTIRLQATPENRARIEVEDNGIGIPEENLARIFQHGFTTKKGGHGFGLHVSANAATEMKSTLSARSEGAGNGATFVLEIPMEAGQLVQAA